MRRLSTTLTALGLSLSAGCATSGYEKAKTADTAEAYREYLHESPGTPEADAAKDRLAELEFERARRLQTPLALKRFLEEFPDSPRRADALALLENLRFDTATKLDSSAGWNDFLRDHPQGLHATDARKKLDDVDFRDAKAATDAKAVRDYIAKHPESPHRLEADKLLDDRLYAEARAAGPRALMSYLDTSSAGAHRDEARAELGAREAVARAQTGDFDAALAVAESLPEAAKPSVKEKVAKLQLDAIAAQLDAKALEAFAKLQDGPLAAEAQARAKALSSDRKKGQAMKELAEKLDPNRYARPEDDLLRVLDSGEPRDRWLAADELGRIGSRKAIDPLLKAIATSRFARLRERSFLALKEIFAQLPPEAVEVEVRSRAESLRRLAQGQDLSLKLAVLDELLGDDRAAADGYAKALRGTLGDDTFVLHRRSEVRLRKKENFSAAVEARELSLVLLTLLKERAAQEGDVSPALASRTLCGARDEARAAAELLQRIPADTVRDFPEDLLQFTQRADEAVRLSTAKLSDAEAAARAKDRSFKGCDDEGDLSARLEDGVTERLKAVDALAALKDEKVRPALELASKRDPSPKVREAAKKALESDRASATR